MQPKSPFWFFPSKKPESLLQKQIDIISKIPKVMTIIGNNNNNDKSLNSAGYYIK